MSTENTPPVAAPKCCKLIESAHKLATKIIQCEQDPDLLSVFSIARAHGYKVTSKFWHDELKGFVEAYEAYQNAKKESQADEAVKQGQFPNGDDGKIVELPAPASTE